MADSGREFDPKDLRLLRIMPTGMAFGVGMVVFAEVRESGTAFNAILAALFAAMLADYLVRRLLDFLAHIGRIPKATSVENSLLHKAISTLRSTFR